MAWSPSWSSWSTHKYFSLFGHSIGSKKEHHVSASVYLYILAGLHSSLPSACPLPRSVWPPPLHPPLHQHKQTGTRIWSRGQMERMVRWSDMSNGRMVKSKLLSCHVSASHPHSHPFSSPGLVRFSNFIFIFHTVQVYHFVFPFRGTVGNKIDFHNIFYASRFQKHPFLLE